MLQQQIRQLKVSFERCNHELTNLKLALNDAITN